MVNRHLIEQHLRAGQTFEDWHGDPDRDMQTGLCGSYIQFDGAMFRVSYDRDEDDFPNWIRTEWDSMEAFLDLVEDWVRHPGYYYRLI